MSEEGVQEIVIEGPNHVVVDYGEGFQPGPSGFSSTDALYTVARRLLAQAGVELDPSQPVQQVTLPYGPHVTVVFPPVAVRGPVLEIRRVGRPASAEELVSSGLMNKQMLDTLRQAVEARRNVVVVGPVGSGVTTLLGALADLSGEQERIVTVEDVPDLALQHEHVVPLSTGGPKTGLSHKEVLQQATRLRSDRLVVDDVRDGEAFDALTVLASRHEGCFLGVHAGSDAPGLDSLRLLAQLHRSTGQDAVDALLARSIQVIVRVGHTDDGLRVLSISELGKDDPSEAQDLFVYDGEFRATGKKPSF